MKLSSYLKNLDSVIAAAAGFIVIYLFTKYDGVGISPDAIMYTSTARNLHDHGTLNFFNNQPIVDFPVFYPIFLGLVYLLTGVDPVKAGPVLDGLLFAGVIFTSGWLMQRFAPKSVVYKWLVLALILLSPALLQVYTYLWSETLFTFLVLIFFIAFAHYLNTRTTKALIIAAVVAAITCITRYAGVTVIGTGGLLLLIDRSVTFKKKWAPILIFGFISSCLLAINLIRNRVASGNSTGPREASITSFDKNLSYFGQVIGNWITITNDSYPLSLLVGSLIIVALIIALLYHTFKRNLNNYLVIAITFSLVYGLFIILSSTFSRYERINDRLLAPMYIPIIWALTWWVIHLPARWPQVSKLLIYAVFAVAALLVEYRLYKIDYQRYDDQFDYGNPGYTDDSWKESGMVAYMRKNPAFFKSPYPIYADAYEAVYFFTGERNVRLLPHRYFEEDIRKFFDQKHFYIIWFKDLDNPELINLKDVQQKKNLKKLQQFNDGAIYEYDETCMPVGQ